MASLQNPPVSSGMMHCWFMVKAMHEGKIYILLRGVNWRGEYQDHPAHAHQQVPWWHVPSCKFPYDPAGPMPTVEEAMHVIKPVYHKEWPALAGGTLVTADQDSYGNWGGLTGEGKIEPVTRLAIDLGSLSIMPGVVLLPGQNLPWPRHPMAWVDATNVTFTPGVHEGVAGVAASPFRVKEGVPVRVETGQGIEEGVAPELPLKESVGTMFVKAFGSIFPTM